MNLPNMLTLARIALAGILMALLVYPGIAAKIVVLVLFLLACATDFFDGWWARRHHQVTDFGKLMDPVADKVLVLGTFLTFVELQLIPAWMVAVIVIREVLITGIRLLAVKKGRVLAAERAGKHKTAFQMITIFFILLFLLLKETMVHFSRWSGGWQSFFKNGILLLMSAAVVLTLYSGFSCVWQNKKLIRSL